MSKPIVTFTGEAIFYQFPEGMVARVYAHGHPLLGSGPIRTSLVVMTNDDGSFETLNTIYKPAKDTNATTD